MVARRPGNPYYIIKEHLKIYVSDEEVIIHLPNVVTDFIRSKKALQHVIYFLRFKIKGKPVFNLKKFPHDNQIQINGKVYSYPSDDIFNQPLPYGCEITLTAPNRFNIFPGRFRVTYNLERGVVGMLKIQIRPMSELKISPAVAAAKEEVRMGEFIDFKTQRVCPACGKILKIDFNFCKYCGKDLSGIKAIGTSDVVSSSLATTAATDSSPEVRKEAVDTLGSFKSKKVLGVLTYVLLNDPDEKVRKEAADELGDLHHPYSLDALALALKDPSAIVRKEAISGLKKIKEKNKAKDLS